MEYPLMGQVKQVSFSFVSVDRDRRVVLFVNGFVE